MKLNKAQEKRFDKKFYVFDEARGYEVQFKAGNFTGSSNAYDFGKKLKQFLADELTRQKKEIIKELEKMNHHVRYGRQLIYLDQAIDLINNYEK